MNRTATLSFPVRCCLVIVAAACWLIPRAPAQDDYADELPRIPPTSPADAMATFRVADGFRLDQVAAEPLVSSPVAIEWDAAGRMYVCEMRGYSEDREEAISRITRLEDTDDDGVYDSRVVFVDGLLWPTALFPFDGGLFVGDAPHLYYFKDDDGDGQADSKQIVLTGFGTSNVQGLMNSCRWGLDNRIHIACSSVGGMIRRPDDDPSNAVNVRGRDISFDPRDGTVELTSGAAQHGMCFDDWGRKFVSSNSNHLQQVMYEDHYVGRNPLLRAPPSRISIAADGPQAEVYRISPVEPWRIVRTRLRVGGLVPGPIEGGGRAAGYFTGATGATIYRGDAWPQEMKGLAIIGDVGSNLVHRKRLERGPRELAFVASRIDQNSEFVASTDIWFRPAQFANAPDGSLHVVDVCREVIEHPKSLPPEIKQHLDLTSGRDRGRIYRIVPDGYRHRPAPRLVDRSSKALVRLLAHPNAWHRETAARLLYERQDPSVVAALQEMTRQPASPLGRMHAMYALSGLGQLDRQTILDRLSDDHPQVRRHAIRLAERLGIAGNLADSLAMLADDPSIDVRYQLAFTAGAFPRQKRIPTLHKIIRRDADETWMQMAVQSSLDKGAGELFALLIQDPACLRSSASSSFLQKLASQIGSQDQRDDVMAAVQALDSLSLQRSGWTSQDAARALAIIGQLVKSRGRGGSAVHRIAASGGLQKLDQMAQQMIASSLRSALDEDLGTASRVAAIEALSLGDFEEVEATLVSLIDNRQPHLVQRTAITSLGKFNSPRVAPPIIAAWRALSPSLRETAGDVLFTRPERTIALMDAVDSGALSTADLGRARLQVAAKSKNAEVKRRAAQYLASGYSQRRADVVASYRKSLAMTGDVARGKSLFQKHCSVCHKVEGFGHELGPSLAAMKTRGAEAILLNVLDPNREVNPEFLNYIVLTVDGRTITGMIAGESATSVTLRRAESATDTILRVDIDRLQSTGLSIMPEGMEENIDRQGMADVIAYLMQVD